MSEKTNACTLLGYPADAKLLIVNADDFGMCHSLCEGGMRAIQEGLATSCSLMVPTPWGIHAMKLLKDNPHIPFSVHLCAVSEYAYYRWKPLSAPAKVPTLIDEVGCFVRDHLIDEMVAGVNLDELEKEFRLQIDTVLDYGLTPSHLDSHYHVAGLRDDIFDMTVSLALEYGLALRVTKADSIRKLQSKGLPTVDHEVLDSGRIELEKKESLFTSALEAISAGLTEWGIHPGIESQELKAIMEGPGIWSGVWEGRLLDLSFITSQTAKDIVREQGIEIIDYRPLQKMWQQ